MKKINLYLQSLSKAILAATLILLSSYSTFAQNRGGGMGGGREGGKRNDAPARVQSSGSYNTERRPAAVSNVRPRFNRNGEGVNRTPNNITRTPQRDNRQPVREAAVNNNTRRPVTANTNRPANVQRPANINRPAPVGGNNLRPAYGSVNRPAYRPVYGYNRPVYNAYNPGWRYGYLPRRNSYFHSLPSSYISINFGGFGYRYWDGVYYRPYNNLFTVVAPPIGIFINTLPIGYRTLYVRDYPYYYYNGTYYDKKETNYYVVSPPVGAVVESLPTGYETVVIDGETYYTIDGAQYKPTVKENGEIWYEVIKAN